MKMHPECARCRHLVDDKAGLVYVCEAFPKGIPEEILSGRFRHTKKHPKQKGDILFEPENRIEICDA